MQSKALPLDIEIVIFDCTRTHRTGCEAISVDENATIFANPQFL